MTAPRDIDEDLDDDVTIPQKDGTSIIMRRNDEGAVEICTEDTCLEIQATASEYLAYIEFFK